MSDISRRIAEWQLANQSIIQVVTFRVKVVIVSKLSITTINPLLNLIASMWIYTRTHSKPAKQQHTVLE